MRAKHLPPRKTERELACRDFAEEGEALVELEVTTRRLELASDVAPESDGVIMLRCPDSGELFVVEAAPDWETMYGALESSDDIPDPEPTEPSLPRIPVGLLG